MNINTSLLNKRLLGTQESLTLKPKNVEQTGISSRLLDILLIKHLSQTTDEDIINLSKKLGLSGNIVEQLLQKQKAEAFVEVRSDGRFSNSIRYGLTDKGRNLAHHELQRDGYLGPAPISLEHYKKLVLKQTTKNERISPEILRTGLDDLILPENIVGTVGPALNSGRAIFIYGLPGTGKTYISRRLVRLFSNHVYIPYAVSIGNQIVQLFDPIIHTPAPKQSDSLLLDDGYDNRLVLCHRPEVVVGGELTADMLEVTMDHAHRVNRAPLQMKANNGILLIDDLGRQKVSVDAILNRWIIPLEEGIDYLSLCSGDHFDIPFEQVLVFSSNIHPAKLADDAFLRRIGYKINFGPISIDDYTTLWLRECQKHALSNASGAIEYVIEQLHIPCNVPLLPCYPRDLVAMCSNQINFYQLQEVITPELIRTVWECYFVNNEAEVSSYE
ncbi:AAA family ATPase [Photobacterium sp. DNB23_23_1]|uniref:AAA family ATPase n=1 Tax=Photobacterium pectinilyticum TaxID=2906793 RepID=A0ABT1N297_9GAMM|nr:AAA family ATPase [Photobacterium sp. ZSDE20]MCQ1058863.1 AAA family ATPase [Photobacterium sp. ZSDE20]MDD1823847.1 AAA family ATPase [Photobacterium sp. ZSDE20]